MRKRGKQLVSLILAGAWQGPWWDVCHTSQRRPQPLRLRPRIQKAAEKRSRSRPGSSRGRHRGGSFC